MDPNPASGGTAGPVTFIVFPSSVPSPVENNSTIDAVGAAAASAWVGGTTTPPTTPPAGTTGPIYGYGGKCVDVAAASTANGTAIQLYDCNGTAAQSWTRATDGTLRALGKCMDVTGAGTANGTKVQLYDCNGSAAQRWTRTGTTLVNAGSGKCLDATGPSSANGTRLQIWTCTGAANQSWTY
ncbi:ricin-type beta-trefoil lectin domain protein [Dactylosporangium aurantiacum]|uniref:Ricin-type beta-trefoil lectin domain protein n=1 Tax=Dactylosporangium aurantiacum TaxID=35754 RepID=A0A9Q9IRB5_9ACTN|nr:ricin-type beta-trefoil lectin domain protein [Dactylosporangium aurantiacum]